MSLTQPIYLSLFLPLALVLSAVLRAGQAYRWWQSLLGLLFLLAAGWQQPLVFLCWIGLNLAISYTKGRLRTGLALCVNLAALLMVKLLPAGQSHLFLPLGLSYAAFQALAFHLDAQQGRLRDFFFFLLFFPKLTAGPLASYQELAQQQPVRDRLWPDMEQGLMRLTQGLVKKLLIADRLALLTSAVYQAPPQERGLVLALLGLLVFPLQLYFDFSGYTDMALGAARCLGYALPENFNRPFAADSLRDFWRRWHLSLTSWFGKYVYLPLGGSRRGAARSLCNTLAVFLLIALWHGIGWGFVLWGLINALIVSLERGGWIKPLSWPRFLRRSYVYAVSCAGFLFFAANGQVQPALSAFFQPINAQLALAQLSPGNLLALLLAVLWLLIEGRGLFSRLPQPLRYLLSLAALVLSLLSAFGAGHLPFIYGGY